MGSAAARRAKNGKPQASAASEKENRRPFLGRNSRGVSTSFLDVLNVPGRCLAQIPRTTRPGLVEICNLLDTRGIRDTGSVHNGVKDRHRHAVSQEGKTPNEHFQTPCLRRCFCSADDVVHCPKHCGQLVWLEQRKRRQLFHAIRAIRHPAAIAR